MLRKIQTNRYEAYLASYRIPGITFSDNPELPNSIRPVWTALAAGASDAAMRNALAALSEQRLFSAEEKAGLLVGLAAAKLEMGSTEDAWETSRKALDLFPYQVAAHRIQISVLASRRHYEETYERIGALAEIDDPAVWDVAIDSREIALSKASLSWLTGQWDSVAEHIAEAYPDGLTSMPDEIQEDSFRLALYRNQPDEAARAAALLIPRRGVAQADEMLQTLVQGGWTSQALPLYQDAFGREPESELLRRRLVALCIKEGQLEEARRLTAPGALRTAA
ncbi:MAG: hypothetical protein JJ896_12555 [Rhodothermales bacterium]|nr:hypothetical protein [Rhodothermales bacterium]MBO6780477.1 hypothetical protein [Rhodothermales bacterium]